LVRTDSFAIMDSATDELKRRKRKKDEKKTKKTRNRQQCVRLVVTYMDEYLLPMYKYRTKWIMNEEKFIC
jgi:hypothetical protein